ncbi:hypothetical protein [Halolamina salifodinae]|uniref:Uncharacterized protein n=1 Tax=Halolamina salifodinae TaxID=1202767 RepID=A0A8T4GZD4_9EURY|nr:hypothetical protein [Halolamina salifodinae]MBP1988336.1 hypothetical protein [Halolamina salifodinae]
MAYEPHEPTFYDTTAERWEEPSRQAFDDSRVVAVDDHFLLSATGFPPESYEDLELPVVDEDGRLNRNALADAGYGPGSVETLDVSEDLEEAVKELIHDLLESEFDSLPQTMSRGEQRDRMLGWLEEQREDRHEAEQKLHTDDEARELEAEVDQDEEERPEQGR